MDAARFGNGLARRAGCTVIVVCACFAGGCKSGTWGAKPSWWTFGGGGQDPAKLASAPAFEGAIPKPSATAKPYPTTTTPNGYALGDKPQAGQVAGAPQSIDPTAVTYGTRPAGDAGPSANTPASGVAAATAAPGLSAVTPQVGPYAGLPGDPQQPPLAAIPPTQSAAIQPGGGMAPLGAGPGFASAPSAAGQAARVADARAADSWPATSTPADSRYGTTAGSRFSSASPAPPADGLSAQPIAPPPASTLQPLAAPPMQAPPSVPAPLEAVPSAVPSAQPLPVSPGSRRPDPQYRPGGTSSYRPSRAILAGDAPAGDSAVQPASFQSNAGGTP